jgi:hypothetical protein
MRRNDALSRHGSMDQMTSMQIASLNIYARWPAMNGFPAMFHVGDLSIIVLVLHGLAGQRPEFGSPRAGHHGFGSVIHRCTRELQLYHQQACIVYHTTHKQNQGIS